MVTLTEREHNGTKGNATTEVLTARLNSTAGATANSTASATAGATANSTAGSTMTPAAAASSTNATAPITSHTTAKASLPPSIATPSGPFALARVHHGPVRHMHHRLATITPEQWPKNFCILVKLIAPHIRTQQKERCIAILGGDKTCGSFYIFLNDANEPGMGVRCEKGGSSGDKPLLAVGEMLAAHKEQSLQFCYDTQSGNASIWKGNQLGVTDKRRWNFQRSGLVSIFVGSHVVDSFAQALYEEWEVWRSLRLPCFLKVPQAPAHVIR